VRSCAVIQGANAATYTIAAADVGRTLAAVVSASKQSVLSVASPVVRSTPGPVAVGRPTIAGTFEQGKQLTGGAGTWTGMGAISYAYQWSRCDARGAHCATIRGATRATYTQVAADLAHTLGLAVRATDAAGAATSYSSLAGLVAAPDAIVVARAQPSLAGTPSVGQTLTVQSGRYTGSPAVFDYQWLRCNANARLCVPIPGAVTASYLVSRDDAGHTLVVQVTAAAEIVLSTAASIPS